jgi:hypothetical protein
VGIERLDDGSIFMTVRSPQSSSGRSSVLPERHVWMQCISDLPWIHRNALETQRLGNLSSVKQNGNGGSRLLGRNTVTVASHGVSIFKPDTYPFHTLVAGQFFQISLVSYIALRSQPDSRDLAQMKGCGGAKALR